MKAKLFDPEKTFVDIKHGRFRGRYPVYTSVRRWRRDYPKAQLYAWHEGFKGDWVLCDDGHVCQVLDRYVLGENKRPDPTTVIRVPWTSAPYYVRKDGSSISRLTFERKRWTSASSMAKPSTPRRGKHWNKKKMHFAWLVVAKGMKPYRAYMLAFNCLSRHAAQNESRYLMKEDRFMKEVANIYKELFDASGLSDKDIAAEITRMAKSEKSSKLKLDALRLALELRGEAPSGTNLNVRFPQLPQQQQAAIPTSGAAGVLKTPARQLEAAVTIEAEPDMAQAELAEAEMAEAEIVASRPVSGGECGENVVCEDLPPLDPNDMEAWRLPNNEIAATGNVNYLEMQHKRSLEKLAWFRKNKLIKRRRGQTIVPPSRKAGRDRSKEQDPAS